MKNNSEQHIPPQDIPAEMSVLGGIFVDNEMVDAVQDLLAGGDFYRTSHRLIFEAMCRMSARNEPIDLVTTASELKNVGHLEEVGGMSYIAVLVDYVPIAANTLHYCKTVAQNAEARRVLKNAQDAVEIIYKGGEIEEARAKLEAAAEPASKQASQIVPMSRSIADSIARLEERQKNKGRITGLSYGIGTLDSKTLGMHQGELIIVAGRPSMGKSAFAGNVASSCAWDNDPVLMFTLEMSRLDVTDRVVAGKGVKYQNIRSGNLLDAEYVRLANRIAPKLRTVPLFIDDTPSVSINDIRSKARRQKKEGLSLVIVDYLQLMRMVNPRDNRVQALGEITRGLKLLARELEIPIMLLSQLSRAVDGRPDKRPMMSDLRDSGEIEQDADVILFPFRPAAYCEKCRDRVNDNDHNYEEHQSKAEIIIEKNRAGERNISVPLTWIGEYQRFEAVVSTHGGLPE